MATKSLAVRIDELEDAIHELAVNKVEEYYIGPTRVRYYDLDRLESELARLKREQRAATTGGITYAKWVRPS